MLFISHNLGVISKMCGRVGVLYAGRLVEEGPSRPCCRTRVTRTRSGCCAASRGAACARTTGGSTRSRDSCPASGRSCPVACSPTAAHLPTTAATPRSPRFEVVSTGHESRCWYHERAHALPARGRPTSSSRPSTVTADPLVRFDDLGKVFKQRGHEVHALVDVSAAIWPGETLGLVGESGSGKTTLARALLGIVEPTSGGVTLEGRVLAPRLPEAAPPTTCAPCRSCSRTRTRHSTGATPCGASCSAP